MTEMKKEVSRLERRGAAFFAWSGWSGVSAIIAMATVWIAWQSIKVTSEMWREDRKSHRPYFALGDRTITPIPNAAKPLAYKLEYDMKNVGDRPARNVRGANMSVDAALPAEAWNALIYLCRGKREIQMRDLYIASLVWQSDGRKRGIFIG